VVVDSEATAKALLARGQLRNRVTIVPLNKARAAEPACVQRACRQPCARPTRAAGLSINSSSACPARSSAAQGAGREHTQTRDMSPAWPMLSEDTARLQETAAEALPQVAGREAPPAVKAAAARLGGGRAALALELVGYDAELGAAMRYAFGSAFVCQARGPALR